MRKVRVIDTETTGLDPKVDRVCEIAFVDLDLDNSYAARTFSTLINPQMEIPPTASAIHHITNDDVADAPSLEWAMAQLAEEAADRTPVAHNAAFDSQFINYGVPWLCTMRLAKHLYPHAPGFSNQVLRYWLKLDPFGEMEKRGAASSHKDGPFELRDLHPHRALHDAVVTATLLLELDEALNNAPLDEWLELSESPILLKYAPFGKYGPFNYPPSGLTWKEIAVRHPRYLTWMSRQKSFDDDVLYTIHKTFDGEFVE